MGGQLRGHDWSRSRCDGGGALPFSVTLGYQQQSQHNQQHVASACPSSHCMVPSVTVPCRACQEKKARCDASKLTYSQAVGSAQNGGEKTRRVSRSAASEISCRDKTVSGTETESSEECVLVEMVQTLIIQ